VGAFGDELRRAREARKITLQEIAATTKISCRALQALEEEHFDQLPGGIFNKGFVRAYARYVGLDEEKTLAAYVVAARAENSDTDLQAMSSQVAGNSQNDSSFSAAAVMAVVAVLVALLLGGLWLREHRREAREAAAAQSAAEPSSPESAPIAPPSPANSANPVEGQTPPAAAKAESSAAPVAAAPPAAAEAAKAEAPATTADAQAAPVELSLTATQRVWISVRSDGKAVETLTMDPDKPELHSRSYKAKEKIVVLLGNPGGVTAVLNGKPLGKLGEVGQRATLTFTPKGMEKQ
jgi:cytoskeletal protein RodZ